MTKFQARTFSFGAALISLLWTSATSARADEAPLCHDMSARRAVLDEGQQYLKQHGDSAMRL
jgi:hypothetical protein